MNAGAIPFRASSAVRALAYVAIFMPSQPHATDVKPPTRNAIVVNRPL